MLKQSILIFVATAAWAGPNVDIGTVPEAVQRVINAQRGQSEIRKIDLESYNGRTYYEVKYRDTAGRNREIYINDKAQVVDADSASKPQFPFRASRRQLSQLPRAAQDAVRSRLGAGAAIEEIDQRTINGQTAYEVEYDNHGTIAEFVIGSNGAAINDTGAAPAAAGAVSGDGSRKVSLNETPAAVQRTIKAQAGSAPVEDIDRETKGGKTTYEAAFKKNGVQTELLVAEDGRILRGSGGSSGVAGVTTTADASAPLGSASKVQLNEVPTAAQTAIKAQAGSAPIEDIDKGTLNGRTVYEAAFKRNGVHTELRVAEDGTVLSGAGTPIVEAAGAATTPAAAVRPAPLSDGSGKVQFSELPAAVQKTLRDQAGAAAIEDIDRETKGGKTTYEAAFKKNGVNTEVRVSEDGTIVK